MADSTSPTNFLVSRPRLLSYRQFCAADAPAAAQKNASHCESRVEQEQSMVQCTPMRLHRWPASVSCDASCGAPGAIVAGSCAARGCMQVCKLMGAHVQSAQCGLCLVMALLPESW